MEWEQNRKRKRTDKAEAKQLQRLDAVLPMQHPETIRQQQGSPRAADPLFMSTRGDLQTKITTAFNDGVPEASNYHTEFIND